MDMRAELSAMGAGRAWAEREADALVEETAYLLQEPWRATDGDALPLVDGTSEERAELARLANRAARDRWVELATYASMTPEDPSEADSSELGYLLP